MSERSVRIEVPLLARVEGEGALDLSIRDGQIEDLRLRIFEPPRLFEKLLEGRPYTEVPDIVARICGICPVAYQMSAVHALERAFRVTVTPWVRAMRRLMYCGEWIESHALHIHLLAAPDFFGYDSVIAMARDYPGEVRRGLRLQALGNEIIRLLGARSVHPVGVRVGGFHHAPAPESARALADQLEAALPDARELVRWTAHFPLPHEEQAVTFVALRHPTEYPMNEGRIVAEGADLDIDAGEFELRFSEVQVAHSTALHAHLDGQPYLVGALARINLAGDQLPPEVHETLADCGVQFPSRNMFHSVVARAAEIHCALLEALRLLREYVPVSVPYVPITPRAGEAAWATEAPRGLLWHRYGVDADGRIRTARIVPPTSQNQARIEQDLRESITRLGTQRTDFELRRHAETIIRNYDPCISCATHFLRLDVKRL
ncbi:MAG TPA: nickel-dependent hydrogenase large subunit [Vicinamibacterales bacterium]|nr:nickel-dependent hydrogenase large subunit [Vicinamibacterales bacterium]